MDFSDIVFAGDREVSRLNNGSVDMFTPVLAHLFFIDNAQELRHKLWIYCQKFDESIPDVENLIGNSLNVARDQIRDSIRLALARQ